VAVYAGNVLHFYQEKQLIHVKYADGGYLRVQDTINNAFPLKKYISASGKFQLSNPGPESTTVFRARFLLALLGGNAKVFQLSDVFYTLPFCSLSNFCI
jgi:hypothetical protein